MTKAEKFNLYADTLYGMCRKAQDTVPEALVSFECDAFSCKGIGRHNFLIIYAEIRQEKRREQIKAC